MHAAYLDTSALMRFILGDEGQALPLQAFESLYSSVIIRTEARRSLEYARLRNRIDEKGFAIKSKELTQWFQAINQIELVEDIITISEQNFSTAVRTLDAIHIASAQWLHRELGELIPFLTHDQRQAQAATSRSLDIQVI